MSREENLQKIEAMLEAYNRRDWDRYYDHFAEAVVTQAPMMAEPLKGRAALREADQGYLPGFPDMHVELERSFGQGDWICVEVTLTGTQTGPIAGPTGEAIPATNRPIRSQECYMYRFEGGQITEQHLYADVLGYMAQLGLAPQS